MTPFEIIICVLVYLGIGVYTTSLMQSRVPAHQALTAFLWPVFLVLSLFMWREVY